MLVGDIKADVKHIRVALEATVDVIEKAVEDEVDLLVVHHPMIFKPMSSVTSQTLEGRKIQTLIKNGMALYAAHSSLDRAPAGLNHYFGKKLKLNNLRFMEEGGYVMTGDLPEAMTLRAFVDYSAHCLGVSSLRYVGADDRQIKGVAFCTGSGMSLLHDGVYDEADVYMTGDLKYHDAMAVYEKGQAVIDITHFASEVMATDNLYDLLSGVLSKDIVTKDKSIVNPIKE